MRDPIRALLGGLATVSLPLAGACAHEAGSDHAPEHAPIADWHLQPDYQLPGNAATDWPRHPGPPAPRRVLDSAPAGLSFLGARETGRISGALDARELPEGPFTLELWMLDHVNTDVGALAGVFSGEGLRKAHWALGRHGDALVFGALEEDGRAITLDLAKADLEAWKRRWIQLVGSWDGEMLRLYHNGRLVAARTPHTWPELPADAQFELASFTGREPYMALENLVQGVRLYDHALGGDEVAGLFAERTGAADAGHVHPGLFHFTAGPYLNTPGPNSINLVVETDRPSRMTLRYGRDTPLSETLESPELRRRHEFSLSGLAGDTPYFYEVTAREAGGEDISSGLLTFQTAVEGDAPFRFAIIGDTEARPFVNHQVSLGVWDARPHFALVLGDLTDGGYQERRFEWTHEYFTGIGQLAARVPFMATPGNGDADLHWFRHYHALPGEENFYSWRYGNAEFFVLDSNLGDREREEPGFRARQREWLEAALAASEATWKIAVHHHPVYTSDENDYGDSWREAGRATGDRRVRNDFMDLYDRHNVDLVLYGHMHIYERSHPMREGAVDVLGGTVYIGAGGGGGNLEDFTPTRQAYSAASHRGYHFGLFDVSGDTITYQLRDTEGRLRDWLTLVKQGEGAGVLIEQAVSESR